MGTRSEGPALGRRRFVVLMAGVAATATTGVACAPAEPARTVFYASVGAELGSYAVDENALTLTRDGVIRAPDLVQYTWVHPSSPVMYVAYSNRSTANDNHGVAAYRIDRGTGRLTELNRPLTLDNRPIHITVHPDGRHLLIAYNQPSTLTVHALNADGSIGDPVDQREPVDAGTYAHQVRVPPSWNLVVLSARGSDATATAPAAPGALKVFRFSDGQLSNEESVTNGDGSAFGPRHVDFHPTQPWMYVSMERNNELLTYGVQDDGITPSPLFTKATVGRPELRAPAQYLGPIHVHPSGRFVYVVNRSDGTVDFGGEKVHGPGENTVAVFSIDENSGEPALVHSVGIDAYHARTFSIHPSGKMLVTAAVAPLSERNGDQVRDVPAGLSVFGIGDDGRLTFARKYDVDVTGGPLFWCGMVSL
ncbi:lactonase family protein [Pseudonocardia cypriaca]|uniref:6-phosphogluconolactonase (Cycloisomerase 2 family) n=1 Tax=Pseudonocardia cypriaca TaxID=882449 RepID=A0A543GD69_9PSEU|nr:beta-propeller fold lactonase family protein [Pseudonocardia cypriaca]TQM43994.1 6-phosphogluconolactonase (cycloisomerase 2 family) [Pseudonocardia cypriaca]